MVGVVPLGRAEGQVVGEGVAALLGLLAAAPVALAVVPVVVLVEVGALLLYSLMQLTAAAPVPPVPAVPFPAVASVPQERGRSGQAGAVPKSLTPVSPGRTASNWQTGRHRLCCQNSAPRLGGHRAIGGNWRWLGCTSAP